MKILLQISASFVDKINSMLPNQIYFALQNSVEEKFYCS